MPQDKFYYEPGRRNSIEPWLRRTLVRPVRLSSFLSMVNGKWSIWNGLFTIHDHTPAILRLYSANASSNLSFAVVSPGTLCEG
jgi:hypothetical protein